VSVPSIRRRFLDQAAFRADASLIDQSLGESERMTFEEESIEFV
jgi:hypothetical protein